MTKHHLKIWPQWYARVAEGSKTYEVRENDREFQFGDVVILQEWDPEPVNSTSTAPKGYTGSPDLEFKVGYIVSLGHKVVFSLLPADPKPAEKPTKATRAKR